MSFRRRSTLWVIVPMCWGSLWNNGRTLNDWYQLLLPPMHPTWPYFRWGVELATIIVYVPYFLPVVIWTAVIFLMCPFSSYTKNTENWFFNQDFFPFFKGTNVILLFNPHFNIEMDYRLLWIVPAHLGLANKAQLLAWNVLSALK